MFWFPSQGVIDQNLQHFYSDYEQQLLLSKQKLQHMQGTTIKHALIISLLCFLSHQGSGPIITLAPAPGAENTTIATMYNASLEKPYNINFTQISSFFNCSINIMYTYRQTPDLYYNNTDYKITISNLESVFTQNFTSLQVQASSVYQVISPSINGSTELQCLSSENNNQCILVMQNGCPDKLDFFNYFDILRIKVQGLDNYLSYNVYCNVEYLSNTFEWGLLIIIVFSTFLVAIVAVYSKAWSIAGSGVSITLPWAIGFNVLLVIGGIIAIFFLFVVNYAVLAMAWFFGILGVALCINELLYLIKINFLRKSILTLKNFQFRVIEAISLIVGVGVVVGWWMSDRNWIVNDIVAIFMIVAGIKFFKFTSLRYAIICFCLTITVEMVFVLLIRFFINASYNVALLNEFNNPFELQAPTINPVYNQKCSWLPITALIYPGCLMAYLRRFDTSRNTAVYMLTSVVCFFLGALLWMFVSIASADSWPFGLIAEPANLALVAFFAWKRKQIRTLWTGKFYDEEFANKEGLKNINELITEEKKIDQIQYEESLFKGLHVGDEQSYMESLGGTSVFPPAPKDFSPIAVFSTEEKHKKRGGRPVTQDRNKQQQPELRRPQQSELAKMTNFQMEDYTQRKEEDNNY